MVENLGLKKWERKMFVHTVYFWVKPGTSEAAIQQLVDDARHYLGHLPTVQYCWVGRPAGTPREVVDNSYAVALTTVMKNREDHDSYQIDPQHLEFIARNKANWERVQIYDAVE